MENETLDVQSWIELRCEVRICRGQAVATDGVPGMPLRRAGARIERSFRARKFGHGLTAVCCLDRMQRNGAQADSHHAIHSRRFEKALESAH